MLYRLEYWCYLRRAWLPCDHPEDSSFTNACAWADTLSRRSGKAVRVLDELGEEVYRRG